MTSLDDFARAKLGRLAVHSLKRTLVLTDRFAATRVRRDGREMISFCCNDYLDLSHHPKGHCQTNLNRPAKGAGPRLSGRQLTPLGQGRGTVLSEDVAAIEVTVLIEMIMDRGVDGGKLLQNLYVVPSI